MKKIFVGNLAWEADEEALKPLFEAYGKVAKINVVRDVETGRSRGFGFVEMETPESAAQAISELHDKPLLGRNLRVSLAQERQDRPERSSGNRGPREGNRGDYRGGGGGYNSRSSFRSRSSES